MRFLRIAFGLKNSWGETKSRKKKQKKIQKEKKSESVFNTWSALQLPTLCGRDMHRSKKEKSKKKRKRGDKVERNGNRLSEVTVHFAQFCCCCFFVLFRVRKDHLKNSGFVVFHSCSPSLLLRLCLLSSPLPEFVFRAFVFCRSLVRKRVK